MAVENVVTIAGPETRADWLGPKISGHPALAQYSSNELAKLLQFLSTSKTSILLWFFTKPLRLTCFLVDIVMPYQPLCADVWIGHYNVYYDCDYAVAVSWWHCTGWPLSSHDQIPWLFQTF